LKITEDEVRYVADLANLRLTDDEVSHMARDLDEILTHIDKLNQLDTDGIEPMAQVLYQTDETTDLRADLEHDPLGPDTALANAPLSGAGHFKVPKVIER
jgi:aspartyl-tRNA(Asn)/glutamyl-tRNA(Gln) amidotransferase subunit C